MYDAFVQERPFISPTGYLDIITLDRVKIKGSFKRGHIDNATNSPGSEGLEGMTMTTRSLRRSLFPPRRSRCDPADIRPKRALLEKIDDAVAKLYVLASGLHIGPRRVGVVHQYLWLDCGCTLMRQSVEVGRPENTFEMEASSWPRHALLDTSVLKSGFNLDVSAQFAGCVHRVIKLGLSIDSDTKDFNDRARHVATQAVLYLFETSRTTVFMMVSCTYIRCCSMILVQRQSSELPATTVGESSRGGSLRRHKGGLWTVHLISHHQVLLQGGFLSVRRLAPGWAKSQVPQTQQDRGGFGGHGSKLLEGSALLNGAVLGVRRHSKASDAMLEHCRVPLAQRGRMSGLVRDMLSRCLAPGALHAADGYARPAGVTQRSVRLHFSTDGVDAMNLARQESAAKKAPESDSVQSPEKRSKRCGHPPPGDQPQNWWATAPRNGGHQP